MKSEDAEKSDVLAGLSRTDLFQLDSFIFRNPGPEPRGQVGNVSPRKELVDGESVIPAVAEQQAPSRVV